MYLSTFRGCALAVAIVLAALLGPVSAAVGGRHTPEVTCAACLLVDDSGRELFARAAGRLLPNASTTKMTTALVVVAHAEPDELVRVSPRAAATGGGGLDLSPGSMFTVGSLLHALLMTSSNDAAVALAEHVAGSEEAFVGRMNSLARRLGASDTHYVTSHGLDVSGHGSSARDLATIAERLLGDPLLSDVVARARTSIPGPDGSLLLENRNLLLESYRGATGVKTGYTAGAGNVLVASAERDGRRLIAVVMDSVDATADARALLDTGWDRLENTVLIGTGQPVGEVIFDHGATAVVAERSVRGPHDPSLVSLTLRPDEDLELPIVAGDVIGEIEVTSESGASYSVEALALDAVPDPDEEWAAAVVADLLRVAGSLVGSR